MHVGVVSQRGADRAAIFVCTHLTEGRSSGNDHMTSGRIQALTPAATLLLGLTDWLISRSISSGSNEFHWQHVKITITCNLWILCLCGGKKWLCCHSDLISAVKTAIIKDQPLFDSVSQASGGLMSSDFFLEFCLRFKHKWKLIWQQAALRPHTAWKIVPQYVAWTFYHTSEFAFDSIVIRCENQSCSCRVWVTVILSVI